MSSPDLPFSIAPAGALAWPILWFLIGGIARPGRHRHRSDSCRLHPLAAGCGVGEQPSRTFGRPWWSLQPAGGRIETLRADGLRHAGCTSTCCSGPTTLYRPTLGPVAELSLQWRCLRAWSTFWKTQSSRPASIKRPGSGTACQQSPGHARHVNTRRKRRRLATDGWRSKRRGPSSVWPGRDATDDQAARSFIPLCQPSMHGGRRCLRQGNDGSTAPPDAA
jgi:hypothetical protein